MRIIAGKYRSIPLVTLDGETTRPSSDRLKEAMFSSLGGFVYGQSWLDAYGGSGAVGLEAFSRGAEYVLINDASKKAVDIILQNIRKCKVESGVEVSHRDAYQCYEYAKQKQLTFDTIFLDPPYHLDVMPDIDTIVNLKLLKEEGMLVVETAARPVLPESIGLLSKVKEKKYGMARVSYYRKKVQE